ncbi:MAG TPA: DUF423 domain-containing protein [Stellaceae bacterium]|nr:DUF423 domain-containing protein [Stellaceae bacterium]
MASRIWILAAGVIGALAIIADAASRHLVAGDPTRLDFLALGARYGLIHALALLGLAALGRSIATTIAGFCFLAGSIGFCGSLIARALGAPPGFSLLTPVGGTLLIVGWLVLALSALASGRASHPLRGNSAGHRDEGRP